MDMQLGAGGCPRLLGALIGESCVCTVHVGESPRLQSAFLEEKCMHSPNQVESQVAKPFPVLACLNEIFKISSQLLSKI